MLHIISIPQYWCKSLPPPTPFQSLNQFLVTHVNFLVMKFLLRSDFNLLLQNNFSPFTYFYYPLFIFFIFSWFSSLPMPIFPTPCSLFPKLGPLRTPIRPPPPCYGIYTYFPYGLSTFSNGLCPKRSYTIFIKCWRILISAFESENCATQNGAKRIRSHFHSFLISLQLLKPLTSESSRQGCKKFCRIAFSIHIWNFLGHNSILSQIFISFPEPAESQHQFSSDQEPCDRMQEESIRGEFVER